MLGKYIFHALMRGAVLSNRIEVAIHEAGHSVIARVLGLKAGGATIRDGNASSYFEDDGSINNVIAIVAGRAATQVILGRADDFGCSIDDDQAMTLLLADGLRSPWYARYMRKYLLDDTRLLIRQHRRAVEAVARALLAKETLTASEIDQLMEASIPS
jgi:ATP-dependent Zn protease